MNFSAITVSFPIDNETYEEVKTVCENAERVDLKCYESVMNLPMSKDPEIRGFFVLIYDDEQNQLAGAASAVDLIGLNTYEWSLVVDPMYRQIGIGAALYEVLQSNLEVRGSEGELALIVDGGHYAKSFLLKNNYVYSFSEATLEAKAVAHKEPFPFTMRKFKSDDTEALCEIFSAAFGDSKEESLQLIEFNSTSESVELWVAERDGVVVGTVSTRQETTNYWLTALAVHPIMAGQGIGSAMINWVKDYAVRTHGEAVLLDVEIENERALSIYMKNNFLVASQIHYYVKSIEKILV